MARIMIAGTNSGCGKTTVTCALLQAFVNRGVACKSFKCGPDYIDPMFHSNIIGTQSGNLDSVFCPMDTVCYLLDQSSSQFSVIEGVMGLYDGVGEKGSPYQIAKDTRTPVIMVVNCKGMSISIGAVMKGFLTYRESGMIKGFIFNCLPESMVDMVKDICKDMNVRYLGRLPYEKSCHIESRHLGLVTAEEIHDLKEKTQKLASLAEQYIDLDGIMELAKKAPILEYDMPTLSSRHPQTEKAIRIGVAKDKAFCFYYHENFELLKSLGCELVPFSPLQDEVLPENLDGMLIGGGYPELYLKELSGNTKIRRQIHDAITDGMPTIAECGGFLYLHKYLQDEEKNQYDMVGVIDGYGYPTTKLNRFGYVTLTTEKDSILGPKGVTVNAHEFHYWESENCGGDIKAKKIRNGQEYICGHLKENLYAGFPHFYYYANPKMAYNFVSGCRRYHEAGKNRK